ncbi:MAG TPA: hypothetical protein VMV69_03670 [Pirellulales bacterium]|nr:hypothetical protein [Pirellulales bacterium]
MRRPRQLSVHAAALAAGCTVATIGIHAGDRLALPPIVDLGGRRRGWKGADVQAVREWISRIKNPTERNPK